MFATDLPTLQQRPAAPVYREDSGNWLGYMARAFGVAIVLAGLGVGAVIAVRKYFPNRIAALSLGSIKLHTLERLRLTPKTTVFILEYNQQKIMLAVHGDSVSIQLLDSDASAPKGDS